MVTGSGCADELLFQEPDVSLDVNVMNFLPVLMDEYFHYHGSLTTGTCDEAVNWMVFKVFIWFDINIFVVVFLRTPWLLQPRI